TLEPRSFSFPESERIVLTRILYTGRFEKLPQLTTSRRESVFKRDGTKIFPGAISSPFRKYFALGTPGMKSEYFTRNWNRMAFVFGSKVIQRSNFSLRPHSTSSSMNALGVPW